MAATTKSQWLITKLEQETHLLTWVEAFMLDRKAQNMSPGTLHFYRSKLGLFTNYCEAQIISQITEITPGFLRQYLLYLEEQGHNPGGIHACYRTLKTFLLWWDRETEPEGWKNPIRKVKAPKTGIEPLEPVSIDTVKSLLDSCKKGTFTGERDKAILLCLLDTGARAQEFLDIDLEDIDLVSGSILIRQGKGRKPRTVFLGAKSRKAFRAYLRLRRDSNMALWVSESTERLSYSGLRGIVRRRAEMEGVKEPSLHSFRRAFAINVLRAGVDIYSLQTLMGHADLQVLRRYLKQTGGDLKAAHDLGSPVNNGRV